MSSKLVDLAAHLEQFDPLHEARLLILLGIATEKHPIDGIMKLAKMDFLLRYPRALQRTLNLIAEKKPSASRVAQKIPEAVIDTVEGRMIRFRYGPWDKRYRKWLSVLVAKDLVTVAKQGRTVQIALTNKGRELSMELAIRSEFTDLAERASAVRLAVGDMSATRLMKLVYKIVPELTGMRWGEAIKI